MSRPVVATRIGIERLDVDPGTHFLAADTDAAIPRLLDDAGPGETLAAKR